MHPSRKETHPMSTPALDVELAEATAISDPSPAVSVNVPTALLRRAQLATSEHGENDDEHDALTDLCQLIERAAGEPNDPAWQITITATTALPEEPLEIPGDHPVSEAAQIEISLDRRELRATLNHQPLALAQHAAAELLHALGTTGAQATLTAITNTSTPNNHDQHAAQQNTLTASH
jgi:hypothetical protein